jgi:hypothetical protein
MACIYDYRKLPTENTNVVVTVFVEDDNSPYIENNDNE